MSLGFQITGQTKTGAEEIERWIQGVLSAKLHPAAEDLTILLEGEDRIVVSAQTSSVGPGYHLYVCDLLRRITAELPISWLPSMEDEGDEIGYFESGDRDVVFEEMLAWLQCVCDSVLSDSGGNDTSLMIGMPLGTTYSSEELLVTQMGPRSRAWVDSVVRDPIAGKDSWWFRTSLGRRHLLRLGFRDHSLAHGRFCICTICFNDVSQRLPAIEIWQSLIA